MKQKQSKKSLNRPNTNRLCHVNGPKPFPLERLLAIFYAISESTVTASLAHIMTQISSLVSKQYLVRHGADILDVPKFVCLAKYEFVLKLAKTVDFELDRHLYDFTVGACSNI